MSKPPAPDEQKGALEWGEDGLPRSRLYGDVYFSAEDGLAETRAVFLAGCGLPEAWAARRRFVVGELGFGTGLNIAALLELWMRTRPDGAQLHIFSIEAHPISAEDARRALARWPELAEVAALLTARWPGRARGVHRIELPEFGAILDLAVMEAGEALAGWSGTADAWFLDGFSPATNPAMWRPQVLEAIAARSAPGARAATFTVAGEVRRGLAAVGFEVAKRPGFGRKRERLEAWRAGVAPPGPATRRVAIVGAGIAGASAARAVRALGAEPLVFDGEGRGTGGSGNPAALVMPRLDAGLGPPARLFAEAFRRAAQLYEAERGAVLERGALQLARTPRDKTRFATIAACDLFEPESFVMLPGEKVGERLGEPASAALDQVEALVVEPAATLAAWAPEVTRAAVARLEPLEPAGWALLNAYGARLAVADAVILTAGPACVGLASGLPLQPVRGQVSWTRGESCPAVAWGGYAIPTRDGILFGATHDRGHTDTEVRSADHARNLATLATALPALAARLADQPMEGRASLRATTPDRLPIAGPAPGASGVFVLTGLGSRGFCLAPLLAEHVAALALGAPSPLALELAELVDPDRFRRRAARRS